MIWRWVIRGVCVALLTLWATAWLGSYFGWVAVLIGNKTRYWAPALIGGELEVPEQYYQHPTGLGGWNVIYGQCDAAMRSEKQTRYENTAYHLLGFAWQSRTNPWEHRYMAIPLWFPTALFAGLLWLVWRKTRPKYNGKGFPVEIGEKAANPPSNPSDSP
jgi:hypothetical protein